MDRRLKTMVKTLVFSTGVAVFCLMGPTQGFAQNTGACSVVDPTGTPLNIRAAPNGRVFSTVRNRTRVNVLEYDFDSRGRRWAQIQFSDRGVQTTGWVISRFIKC